MKSLILAISVLMLASLAFGQAQSNPSGAVYQTPNYNAATDSLTLTGTFSTGNAQAKGQGLYVISGHREDSQCLLVLTSNDGITIKPMFPAGYPGCVYQASLPDTAVRDSAMFHWGSLYYVLYTPGLNAAEGYQFVGLASSPDLINWTRVMSVSTVISGSTVNQFSYAPKWFYDNSTNCAAQDYTCIHAYLAIDPNTGGTSTGSQFKYYEIHPTNTSLTAWSSPAVMTGPAASAYTIDPAVAAIGSTYYLIGKTSTNNEYHVWTASTPTGSWTDTGVISSWAAVTNTQEAANCVLSDTATYRCYFHDVANAGVVYYSETANFSTWTTPMLVPGTNQLQFNHVVALRTADLTTLSNVAARSYQPSMWLNTSFGAVTCGDTQFSISGPVGGSASGNCWGIESVSTAENTGDAYDALHIVSSSSSNSETQHVDIGNYAGINELQGQYFDPLKRTACVSGCGNGDVLGSNWTQTGTGNMSMGVAGPYLCYNISSATNAKNCIAYYSAGTYTAGAQRSSDFCQNYGTGNACGVVVYGSGTSSINGYIATYFDGTGYTLGKVVSGGSYSSIATSASNQPTANGTIMLTVSGTTLTVYWNGVSVLTGTDSSLTSGSPGIYVGGGSYGGPVNWQGGYTTATPQGTGWTDWAKFSPTLQFCDVAATESTSQATSPVPLACYKFSNDYWT